MGCCGVWDSWDGTSNILLFMEDIFVIYEASWLISLWKLKFASGDPLEQVKVHNDLCVLVGLSLIDQSNPLPENLFFNPSLT